MNSLELANILEELSCELQINIVDKSTDGVFDLTGRIIKMAYKCREAYLNERKTS